MKEIKRSGEKTSKNTPDKYKKSLRRCLVQGRVLYGNVVEAENETLVRVDVGAVSVARKYPWGASTPTE